MNPKDFDLFSGIVKERSGLVLTSDKVYLLESRLVPLARRHGLNDLEELAQKLRAGRDEALLEQITEAMTTNETFFFRDIKPFDIFRENVLPRLIETKGAQKSLRIWNAACSTGQEPYSLAMILKEEAARLSGWRIDIVATDISDDVLAKAKRGQYSQFEVQRGLPVQLLIKYFKQMGESWEVDPGIRSMVRFERRNLLQDFSSLGKFDVVFCRNVLIYFDQQTKSDVLARVSRAMPEEGALFLGGAETVLGVTDRFKPVPGLKGVYAPSASQLIGLKTSVA